MFKSTRRVTEKKKSMLKKKKKRKRITKHWSTDGENLGKKKTEVIRKKKRTS